MKVFLGDALLGTLGILGTMPYVLVQQGTSRVCNLHYHVLVGAGSLARLQAAFATGACCWPAAPSKTPSAGAQTARLRTQAEVVESGAVGGEVDWAQYEAATACREQVLILLGRGETAAASIHFERQINTLTSLKEAGSQRPLVAVCVSDLRGAGNSDIPRGFSQYSTDIMAADTLELLEHLGWEHCHLVGQSLGACVALKAAAAAPQRFKSLTLAGGVVSGWHYVLTSARLRPGLALRYLVGSQRSRIVASMKSNFTKEYLQHRTAEGPTRLDELVQWRLDEAAQLEKADEAATRGMAGREKQRARKAARSLRETGQRRQFMATIRHRLHASEAEVLAERSRAGKLRVLLLQGWDDQFVSPNQVYKLGRAVHAAALTVSAGHAGVAVEAEAEVTAALLAQLGVRVGS